MIGKQYHLWDKDKYLGIGTFIFDSYFGFAFEHDGRFPNANKWTLVFLLN